MTLLNKLFGTQSLKIIGLTGLLIASTTQYGCENGGDSSEESNVSTNYSEKADGSKDTDNSGYSGGSGVVNFDVNKLSGASCYVSTRGNASGSQTLHFPPGSSATGTIGLKPNTTYDVAARYSDNDGLSSVNVDINGSNIGGFATTATRGAGEPNGTGWNVFTTAYVGSFTTDSSGKYNLGISSSGDSFGVDMDTLTFAEK
jgi:hypothetical protein